MGRRRMAACAALAAIATVTLGMPQARAAQTSPAGWYVVKFEGRIAGSDHAALETTGAEALQYVPDDSYVAWLERGPQPARAIESVEDVRSLRPADKIDASLSGKRGRTRTVAIVHGRLLPGLLASLPGLSVGAIGRAQANGLVQEVVLLAGPRERERLAERPEVLYLGPAATGLVPEDEGTAQILMGNTSGGQPVAGYEQSLAGRGLDGTGVRVSVVDTGIDMRHPDLSKRVAARVNYGPATAADDTDGHGTHVAGIVAGDASTRLKDVSGLLYGVGVAPKAELMDQNAIVNGSTIANWPSASAFEQVSSDALVNGAVAWNGSWQSGEGANVGYVHTARGVDQLVRDGNWDVPDAQQFAMVFSAGNEGSQPSTITAPKEAKNIIVVGSSLGHRTVAVDPLAQPDIQAVATKSSRGPARDGRLLPTVVAPGTDVSSPRATAATRCATPPIDGAGLGLYGICSGTSMSAAHVTGAVALMTQWWRKLFSGANPSPAMAKALLVNTAVDLGLPDVPNNNEGWGRVHLGALFDADTKRVYTDQSVLLTSVNQTHTRSVRVVDPSKPLKVSLVWTDAPAAAGADTALVNDLDLTVVGNGTTYRGNLFAGGRSLAGALAADRLNNVENVFVPGASGTYQVNVTAANLPGDGVPFRGDGTDQDFALVISNATLG